MRHYKILKIMDLSFPEIETIYSNHPELKEASYEEQKRFLFENRFVYFNDFSGCFREMGHEADDIAYNLKPLQVAWATEHDHHFQERDWAYDIVLKQIETMRPDIVYLQGSAPLPHYVRRYLKRFCPSLKAVVMHLAGFEIGHALTDLDLLLAGTPALADWYTSFGIHCRLLYHGFDESVLQFIGSNEHEAHDFTFVGSSGYGFGSFQYGRYWMLRRLAEETSIDLWLREPMYQKEKLERCVFPRGYVPMQPLADLFPDRVRGRVFGVDMYRVLANSKVTFNKHGEVGTVVGNMRLFEATGVGTCLLTDHAPNLAELFEPDQEVVSYSCIEECLEKLDYLLAHHEERRAVARAAQKRVLKDHTLRQRCCEIDAYIQKLF